MEICRAFDLFESVFMVTMISLFVLMCLVMGYLSWYKYNYGYVKPKLKRFFETEHKGIRGIVIYSIMGLVICMVYFYIKSMFC